MQAKDEGKDIVFYSKGTIVGEAFVVDECIGIGDKSTLYRCHVRENAEHLIALKVLHRSAAQSEDVVARFRKEIRASKEIAHPNVIQCLDYFSNDDGISYVMEYAGGGNLKRFIERFHPIQLERIYQFAYELSAGLEAIHGIGLSLIHI
mgnify:FL=1